MLMNLCHDLENTAYSLEQAFDLLVCLLEFCDEENPVEAELAPADKDFRCRVFAERLNTRMSILQCSMDIVRDEQNRVRQFSDAAREAAHAERGVSA